MLTSALLEKGPCADGFGAKSLLSVTVDPVGVVPAASWAASSSGLSASPSFFSPSFFSGGVSSPVRPNLCTSPFTLTVQPTVITTAKLTT